MKTPDCTLVFDVGKTHVKVTVLDKTGEVLTLARHANQVRHTPPYDSFDTDSIWDWLCKQIKSAALKYEIKHISIATHGAAAALVDLEAEALLLPIMDYEFEDYPELPERYEDLRADFIHTGSPRLPAGLNLGRQLHWQSHLLPERQKKRATILMYPQFWVWMLSGVAASEITSLGCHTDLWEVEEAAPTSLLDDLGFSQPLPPLKKAWEVAGTIKADLAEELDLPMNCQILTGLHDSNAGYLPYLLHDKASRPTVISTGTWSIIMDPQADPKRLKPEQDMLVNIDASGTPLPTARFMGGREFSLICERLNTDIATTFTDADMADLIQKGVLILPSLCQGTGPYPDHPPSISHRQVNGKAAATLYCAFMLADILQTLNPQATHSIVIEGSFAGNEVLCRLLAQLSAPRTVFINTQQSGVVEGCFLLTQWNQSPAPTDIQEITSYGLKGVEALFERWQTTLKNKERYDEAV